MLTMENVGEFLMLQAALEKQGRGALEQWRASRRSGNAL
jgi:hypothetical protein